MRLCPECRGYLPLGYWVLHITFFIEDHSGQPPIFPAILPPTVEAEVVAEARRAAVDAIETHDVEVLIFNPDATHEAPFFRLHSRINVEHQTPNFAQELAVNIRKLIMVAIEPIRVHIDHLEKALRNKLHRKKVREAANEHTVFASSVLGQGYYLYSIRQQRTA